MQRSKDSTKNRKIQGYFTVHKTYIFMEPFIKGNEIYEKRTET